MSDSAAYVGIGELIAQVKNIHKNFERKHAIIHPIINKDKALAEQSGRLLYISQSTNHCKVM